MLTKCATTSSLSATLTGIANGNYTSASTLAARPQQSSSGRTKVRTLKPSVGAGAAAPVGLVPGGGALEWLPRLVGRSRALEIVLSGDDFDADIAERYRWVNRTLESRESEILGGAERRSTPRRWAGDSTRWIRPPR
jgi:hypothetical protein